MGFRGWERLDILGDCMNRTRRPIRGPGVIKDRVARAKSASLATRASIGHSPRRCWLWRQAPPAGSGKGRTVSESVPKRRPEWTLELGLTHIEGLFSLLHDVSVASALVHTLSMLRKSDVTSRLGQRGCIVLLRLAMGRRPSEACKGTGEKRRRN
jgi:hypothetical protein